MNNWFNDFRWDALGARLALVAGAMHSIIVYVPEQYKPWALLAIAILGLVESFIRNPKSLDWVDEAQVAVDAVQDVVRASTPKPTPKVNPNLAKAEALRRQLAELEDAIDTPSRGAQ